LKLQEHSQGCAPCNLGLTHPCVPAQLRVQASMLAALLAAVFGAAMLMA
jgi:hypothetical protein